ncbi:MAG: peptidylprolyl isomerase [Bacteroidales bacterium]
MIIKNDTVGILTYTIKIGGPEGEVLEQATCELPSTMLFGHNRFLPGFEKALMGLTKGDKFDFQLNALESFGDYHKEAVINVPREVFLENGEERSDLLVEGKEIHMEDGEGSPLRGVVLEVTEEKVIVDFNHPLAGHELHFLGEVLDVREAVAGDYEEPNSCCGGNHEEGSCGCSEESDSSCGCSENQEGDCKCN